MLRSLNELTGFTLKAIDQQVGYCKDFIFDDLSWTLRYIVADRHKWLPVGRTLLISPLLLAEPIWRDKLLMVKLMREKIEQCPPLEELSPVTREWETAYSDFLGLPYHWQETAPWTKVETTLSEVADLDTAIPDGDSHTSPRLHSTTEVKGYEIHALDGIIGHVHDFLLDDTTWRITALAINTRNWLPGGRNVVVHEESMDSVCIEDKFVKLTLTTEAIGSLPEYDPDEYKDPDYEIHRS